MYNALDPRMEALIRESCGRLLFIIYKSIKSDTELVKTEL